MTARLRAWLDGLTLRQQLLAIACVVLAALAAVVAWQSSSAWSFTSSQHDVAIDNLRQRLAMRRLQAFYGYGIAKWSQQVVHGVLPAARALEAFRAERLSVDEAWDVLARAPGTGVDRAGQLPAILALRAAADRSAGRLERALASGRVDELRPLFVLQEDASRSELLERLDDAVNRLKDSEAHDLEFARDRFRWRQMTSLGAAVVGVAATLLLAALWLRRIYGGVRGLAEGARRIAARDFQARFDPVPHGELGELAQALVTMQGALAQYERELQNSERLFQMSADLLCIADTDGHFRRVNPAFGRTLGHEEAELLARPFIDFVHPDDVAATRGQVARLAQGLPSIDFENRYRCRDGTYKWLNWRCQPAADGTLYAIARDTTETRRLLDELHERQLEAQAANQAKSAFLATMSHEIRTPLVGVVGMLDVFGRTKLDAGQRRQFNIVQQSAQSLLQIIGDILDYSKIEAGKVELDPETLSIRDLVSRVVSMYSANAESKGLQLVQQVAAGVAAAHIADGVRLVQILRNFVSNAIKFTESGSVTVAVSAVGDRVQHLTFSVADTGIGISPEQLGRLFQPFTQSDAGATRRFGGTGLGLVICQRLSQLMGGAIHVTSTPGRGTVITLELTLPVGDPKDVAAAANRVELPVATRVRPTREQALREGSLLLLAEDHPLNRLVLAQQIDLAGFHVDTAEDGPSALSKFKAGAYGLVFTDLHMPGLDGFQLVAAIREHERDTGRPRTPVIALTANVMREDIERCLAGDMDGYLSKPVTIQQLVEKLRKWLPHVDWQGPSAAPPPVDPSVLGRISAGDASKARELLRYYCETSRDDVRSLEEARHDGAAVEAAHRIKGAALAIGATEVAEIAARIEHAARESGGESVAALVRQLREAMARVESQLLDMSPPAG
jgi:two-component system, NarL family, sensor histidine kinase EvgS